MTGRVRVSAMDHQCFLATEEAQVNYMNCSMQDEECVSAAMKCFTKVVKMHPKMRYKVVRVAGDLYYEMMSIEETI